MIYSEKLKVLKENNNLTQEKLAKVLNIERSAYSLYEMEYTLMPIKHLNSLANYFNVSLDYMFGFTDKTSYENSICEIDKLKAGERLKIFRKDLKISQTKLAAILNSSFSTIAGYEQGRYIIATPFLYTICKKYKVSADYLLGKIDYMPNND